MATGPIIRDTLQLHEIRLSGRAPEAQQQPTASKERTARDTESELATLH